MQPKKMINPQRKKTQAGTLMPGPRMKSRTHAPLQTRKSAVPKDMGSGMPGRKQTPPNC